MLSKQLQLPVRTVSPLLPAFLDCWASAAPSNGSLPDADAIFAAAAKCGLPMGNMSLMEVREPFSVIVLSAGASIRQHLGFDLSGTDVIAKTTEPFRSERFARFALNVDFPCGVLVRDLNFDASRPDVAVEALNLPINGVQGEKLVVSMVVGFEGRAEDRQRIMVADLYDWVDLGHGTPTADDFLTTQSANFARGVASLP